MGVTTSTAKTIIVDSTDLPGLSGKADPSGITIILPPALAGQVTNFPLEVLAVYADLVNALAANEDIQALVAADATPPVDEPEPESDPEEPAAVTP